MKIIFDDDEFDLILQGSLPHCGEEDLAIVVNEKVTDIESPAACITFFVTTDSGSRRVQMGVTVKELLQVTAILGCRYPHLMRSKWQEEIRDNVLVGQVDGVGWTATYCRNIYVVKAEGNSKTGIATTQQSARKVAKQLIREG